jgi:hypothetical protein
MQLHVLLGLYEWFEKWADKPVRNRGEDYLENMFLRWREGLNITISAHVSETTTSSSYHIHCRDLHLKYLSRQPFQHSVRSPSWHPTRRVATELSVRQKCFARSIGIGQQLHSPKFLVYSWRGVMHSCRRSLALCTEDASEHVLCLEKLDHCG